MKNNNIAKEQRLKEEIETQNFAAALYEEIRYKNPYSKKWHDWHINAMISMVDNLKKSGCRVLDNGCGVGIVKEYIPDAEVVGLDISPAMVEIAKKKNKNVIVGDSEKLPFEDGSFDVVLARALLHHVTSPEQAIKETARVLNSGGEVVFSDTMLSLVSWLPRKIANRGEHFSSLHKNFKKKEIINLINKYLEVEQVIYFGFIAYPLLALPDVANFVKFIPFKKVMVPLFLYMDNILSRVPIINKQGWGIMIKARKK